jgi:hypothetical protein
MSNECGSEQTVDIHYDIFIPLKENLSLYRPDTDKTTVVLSFQKWQRV